MYSPSQIARFELEHQRNIISANQIALDALNAEVERLRVERQRIEDAEWQRHREAHLEEIRLRNLYRVYPRRPRSYREFVEQRNRRRYPWRYR